MDEQEGEATITPFSVGSESNEDLDPVKEIISPIRALSEVIAGMEEQLLVLYQERITLQAHLGTADAHEIVALFKKAAGSDSAKNEKL